MISSNKSSFCFICWRDFQHLLKGLYPTIIKIKRIGIPSLQLVQSKSRVCKTNTTSSYATLEKSHHMNDLKGLQPLQLPFCCLA